MSILHVRMNISQVKMIEVTKLQPLLLGGSVTARARTEQNLGLGGSPVGGGVTAGAAAARRRRRGWSRDAHRTEQGHARRTEPRRACSWSWAWSPACCRSTPRARELAAACVRAERNGRNLLLTLASGTYIRPKFLSIARQLSRYSIPFPPAAPAPSIWAVAIT